MRLDKVRKFIVVLMIFIVGISVFFGFYLKGRLDSLSQNLVFFVEARLGKELISDIAFREARIGLFDHLTLYDLSISSNRFGERFIVKIEEVALKYKPFDILSGRFNKPSFILVRGGKFKWNTGHFLIERENIDGVIELVRPTEAKVTFRSRDQEEGSFRLLGTVNPGEGDYNLVLRLVGLDPRWGGEPSIPITDISGTIFLDEEKIRSDLLSASCGRILVELSGEVETGNTNPQLDCFIRARSRFGGLSFLVGGELIHPHIDGSLNLPNRSTFPFYGDIDFRTQLFSVEVGPKKELKLLVKLGESFEVSLKADHLNINGLDVVSELNLDGAALDEGDGRGVVVGRFSSKNSILDYEPFMELEGSYQLEGTTLKISSLTLGDVYRAAGTLELRQPFHINLVVEMDGSDMEDLLIFTRSVEKDVASGKVEGRVELVGPANSAKIKGHCVIRDGKFGELEYNSMIVDLEGEGKVIELKDSRIHQKEGTLILEGEIDLAKANPCESVVVRSEEGTVIWDGWHITKAPTSEELTMGKVVGEDFKINLKTYLDNELSNRDIQHDELTLEYGLGSNKSIKIQLRGDEEFLGLEHKLEF